MGDNELQGLASATKRPDQAMIERVASAVEAELQRQSEQECLGLFVPREGAADWIAVDGNIDMTPLVRAVLTAMRDLTVHEQVTFGHALASQVKTFPQTPDPVLARHTWSAMIDAALAQDAR